MITIRPQVFETNSSSEHALKVNKDAHRKPEDFPALAADGFLEIEATRYWESGISVTSVRDIMEYICLLDYTVERNYDSAFDIIKQAYKEIGLREPMGIRVYVTDREGHHFLYESDDYLNGPHIKYERGKTLILPNGEKKENSKYTWSLEASLKDVPDEVDDRDYEYKWFEFDNLDTFVGEHATLSIWPMEKMLCEIPIIPVMVGISCNCLVFGDTLRKCLDVLVDDEDNYEYQDIADAFRYESTLYFYHS